MMFCEAPGGTGRTPPACVLEIGGKPFSEYYGNLRSTEVKLVREGSGEAVFVFELLRNMDGTWPLEEEERLSTWAGVTLQVVFGSDRRTLFRGHVREINSRIGENGVTGSVTVTCQDLFGVMDRFCRKRTLETGGISELLRQLLSPYLVDLDVNVPENGATVKLQNKSDYRLIRELAESGGYEWFLSHDRARSTLHFRVPQVDGEPTLPPFLVRAGRHTNCLSFDVSFDGYRPDRVRFSPPPATQAEADEAAARIANPSLTVLGMQGADSSDADTVPFEWCTSPGAGNDAQDAERRANGLATRNDFKLKATGRLDGTVYGALLTPGNLVEVGGAGAHSGRWYVDSTRHRFDAKGYFVDFVLLRNASRGAETPRRDRLQDVRCS